MNKTLVVALLALVAAPLLAPVADANHIYCDPDSRYEKRCQQAHTTYHQTENAAWCFLTTGVVYWYPVCTGSLT